LTVQLGTVAEHHPIYLFDNEFIEKAPELGRHYEVPEYFREDLFSLLKEPHRPSFRWILIGPPRSGNWHIISESHHVMSGASYHKDPNATSAWNGLISGSKKWILLPPDVTPPGVFPSADNFEVIT
jgi:hypothetical protein